MGVFNLCNTRGVDDNTSDFVAIGGINDLVIAGQDLLQATSKTARASNDDGAVEQWLIGLVPTKRDRLRQT